MLYEFWEWGSMAKCKYCGKQLETKAAYVVKKFSENLKTKYSKTYFCTEIEYVKWINKNSYRDSINKVLEYLIGDKIPYSLFRKEITDLYDLEDGKVLNDYLVEQKDYLNYILSNKSFVSIYAKCKYLIAVIKNKATNYNSNQKQDTNVNLTSVITDMNVININNYKDTKKRRNLAEIEDNL